LIGKLKVPDPFVGAGYPFMGSLSVTECSFYSRVVHITSSSSAFCDAFPLMRRVKVAPGPGLQIAFLFQLRTLNDNGKRAISDVWCMASVNVNALSTARLQFDLFVSAACGLEESH